MANKKLVKGAKDTLKLGVLSMGGMTAMGALGGVAVGAGVSPHAVQGLQTTTGAALGLANVGNLAKQSFVLVDVMDKSRPGKSKKMWAPVETKASAKRRAEKKRKRSETVNTWLNTNF